MEMYFRVELCDGGFDEFYKVVQEEMKKGNILLFEGMSASHDLLIKPIQDCEESLALMHRLRECMPYKHVNIMPYQRNVSQVG